MQTILDISNEHTPKRLTRLEPDIPPATATRLMQHVRSAKGRGATVQDVDLSDWNIEREKNQDALILQGPREAIVLPDGKDMQNNPYLDVKQWLEQRVTGSPYYGYNPNFTRDAAQRLKTQLDALEFDEEGNCIGPDSEA